MDLFEVFYEDGDIEDLEEHELNEHLLDRSLICYEARNTNRINQALVQHSQSELNETSHMQFEDEEPDHDVETYIENGEVQNDQPSDSFRSYFSHTAPTQPNTKPSNFKNTTSNGTMKRRTVRHSCACCLDEEVAYKAAFKQAIETCDGLYKTRKCKFDCGTLLYPRETDGRCCNQGKIVKHLYAEFPDFFTSIPTDLDQLYIHDAMFQRDARRLNNLFNFSVIGASGPDGFSDKKLSGIKNVQISGRTYTRIFSINDENENHWRNPIFWCVVDPDARKESAFKSSYPIRSEKSYDVFDTYMRTENQISKAFAQIPLTSFKEANVLLRYKRTGNEVAVLIQDDIPNPDARLCLVQRKGDNRPVQVSPLASFYEPLRYPVLFPHQSRGWGSDLHITQADYYKYLIHYRCAMKPAFSISKHGNATLTDDMEHNTDRSGDVDHISLHDINHHQNKHFTFMNRLFNEYLCDMYSRMIDERILYWRRADVQAAIHSYREYDRDTIDNDTSSKKIYMPAQEYGSRRRARKNVNDGIELCNVYGKPDFFITLTANPMWSDIQYQIGPGQTWADRPDVVNRVFKQKLEDLLEKLRHGRDFFPGAKQVKPSPLLHHS